MPTPPPRRRPAGPPIRRPRVAGLRKPTAAPEPEQLDQAGTAATETAAAETPAVEAPSVEAPAETPAEPKPRSRAPRPGLAAAAPEVPPGPSHVWRDERETEAPRTGVIGEPSDYEASEVTEPGEASSASRTADSRGAHTDSGNGADSPDDAVSEEDALSEEDAGGRPATAATSRRPAGKKRATGVAVPTERERVPAAGAGAAPEDRAAGTRSHGINAAIGLAVLALALAGGALWFKGEADSLTAGADSTNRAITDGAATSEVRGKLTVAVERALSYNYTDLDATAVAVKETLAGNAVCEYDQLFGQLKTLAPQQKLVLTTKVREMGVQRLEGDQADLLVFVDQSTTRTDQNQTSASGAQFGIRAERQGGVWKITDFDMLNQPLPNGQAADRC